MIIPLEVQISGDCVEISSQLEPREFQETICSVLIFKSILKSLCSRATKMKLQLIFYLFAAIRSRSNLSMVIRACCHRVLPELEIAPLTETNGLETCM